MSEPRIRLPLRISASLKTKLAVLAKREHRSLNKQIEFLLDRWAEQERKGCRLKNERGSDGSAWRAGTYCIVALPQQRLYFFPEPHGQGSLRPVLTLVYKDSGSCVLCSYRLKYRYAVNKPAAINSYSFSRCLRSIGLGRMDKSSSCSW